MVIMDSSMHFNGSSVDQMDGTESFSNQDGLVKLENFWTQVMEDIRTLPSKDFKEMELPIARIKRIMKLDEDVKMIAAETPVIFAKAAEIFIKELTLRAWIHTEENRRRTLQRNDISAAAAKSEMFDFLIDVLPREEAKASRRTQSSNVSSHSTTNSFMQQTVPHIDNSASISVPATIGGGDQMQQIIIQLPASILSALTPQRQTGGITIMQQMPMAIPGAVPQQQMPMSAEEPVALNAEVPQIVTIGSGELNGGTIHISAAQLQQMMPGVRTQSMQPQN